MMANTVERASEQAAAGSKDAAKSAAEPGRSTLVESDGAAWESIGATGEGSDWMPAPSLHAMDASAERETDITSIATMASREGTKGRRTVGVGEVFKCRRRRRRAGPHRTR